MGKKVFRLIVLDTDILINILRKKNRGEQWKDFLKDKSIAFTTITGDYLFQRELWKRMVGKSGWSLREKIKEDPFTFLFQLINNK